MQAVSLAKMLYGVNAFEISDKKVKLKPLTRQRVENRWMEFSVGTTDGVGDATPREGEKFLMVGITLQRFYIIRILHH